MNTVLFYCVRCATAHRPHDGDLFVTTGKKDNYIIHIVEFEHKNYGFSPHTVKMTKSENGNVFFTYRCAMNRCGYIIEANKEKKTAMAWEIKGRESIGVMPIKEWNAMIMYYDDDYSLD
jgi:hypothetical protein